jgi:primosomal protein N' (replication factor Y) (superfamily II helicase)
MSFVARVLLPLPLPEAFDYAVPDEIVLAVGDHVAAPLGPRLIRGVVTELRDARGVNRPLKPISARLEDATLPANTLAFIAWAARYACEPPGEALAMALRGLRARQPAPERLIQISGKLPTRLTPARERVLAAAIRPLRGAALAEAAGVSAGVVKGLVDDGALAVVFAQEAAAFPEPDPSLPGAVLNPSQAAAAAALVKLTGKGDFQAVLLDGVTGSGKTEVYLEAVAAVLKADPRAQVLVLLPEIALTQAVIARFAERFGVEPAEWHSGVAPPKRRRVWEAVVAGRCRIVVGARSALFLPFPDLRLVVVDEEHDASFKQEDGFVYHARDLAVARAKIEQATVVLASATPSLESVWNAQAGRYAWLKLSSRHGVARLPEIELIDMREAPPERGHWLSPRLVTAMVETLARGEQSLLFLNRRGYAPLVLCKACGERMTSPDTDSWLVEHRYSNRLVCHLTGFSMPKPEACPHCGAKDSLTSIGPGVERLEEEARSLFPDARVEVFSSDTVADAEAARALVARMAGGEIDILVATQAAAKGHNFPGLTLVGVVDADLGLRGGDLRAAERTYQLLAQVAGRAGRAERAGRALIQTYTPEHQVMQALKANDRDAFLAAEAEMRELSGLPPYGRLAALILSSPDGVKLDGVARALAAAAPSADGVEVYGPADAPLALIRGRRRKRFLVRADRRVNIQAYLEAWLARVKVPGVVRVSVDVDPYSFL